MVTLSLQKNVTKIEILEYSYDNKQRQEKFEKFVVLVARWPRGAYQITRKSTLPGRFVFYRSRVVCVIQPHVNLALLDTREDSVEQQQGLWAYYQRLKQTKQTWRRRSRRKKVRSFNNHFFLLSCTDFVI